MNFERGKDPKETLELGLEKSLLKFLHSHTQFTDKRDHQLLYSVIYGKTHFVEYLLTKGAKLTSEMLRISINKGWVDIAEIIISSHPNFKKGLYIGQTKWKKIHPAIQKLL